MKVKSFNFYSLMSLSNSMLPESTNSSGWHEVGGRSPPTPPGSVWQPAPPFQCLSALGAAPKTTAPVPDTARYHSLGRPLPATLVNSYNT